MAAAEHAVVVPTRHNTVIANHGRILHQLAEPNATLSLFALPLTVSKAMRGQWSND